MHAQVFVFPNKFNPTANSEWSVYIWICTYSAKRIQNKILNATAFAHPKQYFYSFNLIFKPAFMFIAVAQTESDYKSSSRVLLLNILFSISFFLFLFSDWVIGWITNRLLGCMLAVIKHKCGGFFCTVLSVKGVYLTFSMCYLVWQTQLPHMNDSIYLTKTVLLHFYHVHACFLSHLSSTL